MSRFLHDENRQDGLSAFCRILRATAGLFITSMLYACSSGCPLNASEVRNRLSEKLAVGDEREKIEAVLKKEGIGFSYNEYSNRYNSTIRDEEHCGRLSLYKALSLRIYLDDNNRLLRLTVKDSFTFL